MREEGPGAGLEGKPSGCGADLNPVRGKKGGGLDRRHSNQDADQTEPIPGGAPEPRRLSEETLRVEKPVPAALAMLSRRLEPTQRAMARVPIGAG